MRKSDPHSAPPPGLSLAAANLRIADLSKTAMRPRCEREQLDRRLDSDIRVSGDAPARSIALLVDEQVVSGCTVIAHQQQIGHCLLRMAGIGGVFTHDDHRFKGYSRRVMENALRWMRHEGYDLSMLFGITGFYPKFGFAPAFPDVTYTLLLRDAERAVGQRCRFVDFAPEHLAAVLSMHRQNTAGRNGVLMRDEAHWRPFRAGIPWGVKVRAKVALDARRRPVGYFAQRADSDAEIIEVGYASPTVFPDLLRGVAELAWAARAEKLVFLLPEDDAFMAFCTPLGLHKEVRYRRDGGAMIRLIHPRLALQRLAPLLATRVSGAGCLTLKTNLEPVGISWGDGVVTVGDAHPAGDVVRLPQWALAQMVYGYLDAESPAFHGVLHGTAAALSALARLFPVTPHYCYRVDHF